MIHPMSRSVQTTGFFLLLIIIQACILAAEVQSQELSQIDRGVIEDRVRSYIWFRDAGKRSSLSGVADYRSLSDFGLMNDSQLEGLRQGIEADEWFRRYQNQGPQDIKSLFQKMQ